jgi:hypothetical protein
MCRNRCRRYRLDFMALIQECYKGQRVVNNVGITFRTTVEVLMPLVLYGLGKVCISHREELLRR